MTTTQNYTEWKADRLASRRLTIWKFDPYYLRSILTGQDLSIRAELPDDATILTIQADASGLFLLLLVHSETFDPVPPYERPPELHPPIVVSVVSRHE